MHYFLQLGQKKLEQQVTFDRTVHNDEILLSNESYWKGGYLKFGIHIKPISNLDMQLDIILRLRNSEDSLYKLILKFNFDNENNDNNEMKNSQLLEYINTKKYTLLKHKNTGMYNRSTIKLLLLIDKKENN